MNIYDTKIVFCSKCYKGIGEIEFDSSVSSPLCGFCLSRSNEIRKILFTKINPNDPLIGIINAA